MLATMRGARDGRPAASGLGRLTALLPAVSLALVAALLLAGCSSFRSARRAQIAEQRGDWDEAVLLYLDLVDRSPGNVSYRTGLLRAKIKASQDHFERGKELHAAGALERALEEYQQAVQLDPSNQFAQVELEKLAEEVALARRRSQPTPSLEELKSRTRGMRPQPPVLDPRSDEPISLSFPKPVNVFDIYRALGKAFGINVLFDPKLRPQEIAIELEDVVAQSALEILMRSASHFYKVLDEHTIIVAEDNPQNRRNYEDLVIQTFFLSNAEVKDVMTMLRSLVGAKNIAANDQLNAIVLRDSADKVKVAESIILTNDKSRGEMIVDVELLQIGTQKMLDLGISLSQYQIGQRIDAGLSGLESGEFRFSDLEFLDQADWLLTIPSFIYEFIKTSTDAQLLASPQVRISDGEKATVHIGDRLPIPVTTFNTGQTVGGNIVPITSFQYQDIGIRLDIEPRIHHNKEITLKIKVEVSNLSGFVEGQGGQQQPIIGTRNIESTIRLMDGETNFLAGLIRTDDTEVDSGIPGLSDIPILGRLFTSRSSTRQRTDLILTLTPHIIRTPNIEEQDLLPIWVGTEANISFRGASTRVESDVEGPFDEEEGAEADRIREMIRRRIQNLPRGLRDQGEAEAPEEPPGVELVPSAPPRDIFQPQVVPDEDVDEEAPDTASLAPLADEAVAFGLLAAADVANRDTPVVPVKLRLVPARRRPHPGELVEVELVAETTTPVSHLPVTLRFDPEVLEVRRVVPGGFLGAPDDARVLADDSRPGVLVLGASRLGEVAGVVGTGTVARIRFRTLAAGPGRLRIDSGRALGPDLEPVGPVKLGDALLRVVANEEDGP